MKKFFSTISFIALFTLSANAQEVATTEKPKMACCAKDKKEAKSCHSDKKAEATEQTTTEATAETKKCTMDKKERSKDKKECSKDKKVCTAEEMKSCDKDKKASCCMTKKEEKKS